MEFLNSVPSNTPASTSFSYGQSVWLSLVILPVALAAWLLELRHRSRGNYPAEPSPSYPRFSACLRKLAPELAGLALITALIIWRLSRPDGSKHQEDPTWNELRNEWPLLKTADSLLGIQATLRLLLVVSATIRRTEANASPFDGETAGFLMFSVACRLALPALSPADVYQRDGPLGGQVITVVDFVAFILLLPKGGRILRKDPRRIAAFVVVTGLCAFACQCNRFAIADEEQSYLDTLFGISFLLDLPAAVAFLVKSALASALCHSPFASWAHVLLTMQQSMAMYFVLTAFAPPFQVEQSIVAAGKPFELLQVAGLAQVGMYLCASVLHFMSWGEDKDGSNHLGVYLAV